MANAHSLHNDETEITWILEILKSTQRHFHVKKNHKILHFNYWYNGLIIFSVNIATCAKYVTL